MNANKMQANGIHIRVLMLEDDPIDARMVVRKLKENGYELEYDLMETESDFLKAVVTKNYDVILSDYALPGWTGVEAYRRMIELGIDTPFVLVTGALGEELAVQCIKEGITDYVLKYNLTRLPATVASALRNKELKDERQQAEEALRVSAIQWQTTFDAMASSVCLIDQDFRIQQHNKATESLLGKQSSELIGKHCWEIVHGTSAPIENCPAVRVRESHQQETLELKMTDRWFEVTVDPMFDETNNFIGAVHILTDITERKLAEEEIAKARALEELEGWRATLLASISHELRTPLTSIKGLASTLVQPDIEWSHEDQQDFLHSIVQESDRLNHIVSDLLDISRLEAGVMKMEKTETTLIDIIRKIEDELRVIVGKHRLESHILPPLSLICADEIRIGQVITNLVSNAASYSEEGTVITLEAVQAGDEIVISVIDQGVGIPSENLEKVFDRFYRLEEGVTRRRGGSGLGLSICKAIIESHNGRIWVESTPNQGSRFSFALPILVECKTMIN